jgi:lipopolysaccharide export LptBFGC system permease protein LptF
MISGIWNRQVVGPQGTSQAAQLMAAAVATGLSVQLEQNHIFDTGFAQGTCSRQSGNAGADDQNITPLAAAG